MSSPTPRIVAVGDLTADLIIEVPKLPVQADEFQVAGPIRLEPGGSANLLILLSRLGAEAAALGTVGTDLWGEQVLRILDAEGIEVSSIRRGGTTTVALVFVDGEGRHAFVGSFGQGEPRELGEREQRIVIEADALFASGYSLAEARLRDLALNALEHAGLHGIPRFFDSGPAFRNLDEALQERAIAAIDVLLLTEEELQDLSVSGAESLLSLGVSGKSDFGPTEADGESRQTGPHTLVVKRGAAGCRIFAGGSESNGSIEVPGLAVPVRDSTAAGDCFDAGYLLGYLKGWPPMACARLANCAGAAAVQKIGGGRNVPTVEELRRMIAGVGGGVEI
ncbi:MAG: hypothetical protein JSV89_11770 [Spirochaetaceae bacterium]|nr:MAG: hypothetical protein JSV89_11770 [Spirochaetaceae bacterium]